MKDKSLHNQKKCIFDFRLIEWKIEKWKCINSHSSFKQNKLWTFQRIMITLNHAKMKLEAIMGNIDVLLIPAEIQVLIM